MPFVSPQKERLVFTVERRQRKQQMSRHQFRPSLPTNRAPFVFIILSIMMWFPSVRAQMPFRSCYSAMSAADSNNDNILTQAEYATSLQLLTSGIVNAQFGDLDAALQGSFNSRVPGGGSGVPIVTSGGDGATEIFCVEIFEGLAAQLGISVPRQRCFIAMAVGDINEPKDILSQEPEFVRYANQMAGFVDSSYEYGVTSPFSSLPSSVKTIYSDFSDDMGVQISGSKLGTTPTLEEELHLRNLCAQTFVAVEVGEQAVPVPTPSPIAVAPTNPAPPSTDCFDFDFDYCVDVMLPSDISRDNTFVQVEYIRFVNFLSNNTYANQAFSSLPQPLQSNWDALATFMTNNGEQIPIFGSKPFETPDVDQQRNLENVCNSTKTAIFTQCQSSPGSVPTAAPVMSSVPVPTVDYVTCTRSMLVSDVNPRDSALEPNSEYVSFTNQIADNIYAGLSYEQLPDVMKEAFAYLATDGVISIVGALPGQNPDAERRAELEEICSVTLAATVGISPSSSSPTPAPAPTGEPTPARPLPLTVYNAFYISNTENIRASTLASGQNRDGIDQGYRAFIQNVVSEYLRINPQRTRRTLRSRTLEIIGLNAESIEVYEIEDVECPETVTEAGALCQIVYGRWDIDTLREPDLDALQAELTTFSQGFISAPTNNLNSFILAANPGSDVTVAGPADTLRPETDPPTPSPPPPPNSDDGGANVGAIVGSIVGILAVAGGGYYLYQHKRNGGEFRLPSFPKKFTGPVNNNMETESAGSGHGYDEDEGRDTNTFGKYRNDAMSDDGKSSMFGGSFFPSEADESDSQQTGKDSQGFSIQEQSPSKQSSYMDDDTEPSEGGGGDGGGKGTFGAFGFGGKKKSSAHKDAVEGLDNSQSNNDEDFYDYQYDDETPKDGSASKDMFNDDGSAWSPHKQGSPGWDNDSNTSWGNSASPSGMFSAGDSTKSPGVEDYGYGDDRSRSSSHDDDSDSSGDDTYDEGTLPSIPSRNSTDDDGREIDDMVDQGDWDGVVGTANDKLDDYSGSSDVSGSSEDSGTFGEDDNDPSEGVDSRNLTPKEMELRDKYRLQVEELVKKVVPNEMENISAMMDQFMGREAELLKTLETMYDRSSNQRARKAIHKSKGIPQQAGRFSAGGLDGSAAIAAASTLEGGVYEDDGTHEGDDQGSYYSGEHSGSGSYSGSGSHSGSGSYSDEGSYDEEERSRSDRSGSGSYDDEGSYRSGSGSYSDPSHSRSYSDRSGSYSGSGSYPDEGSYESGSGSYED